VTEDLQQLTDLVSMLRAIPFGAWDL